MLGRAWTIAAALARIQARVRVRWQLGAVDLPAVAAPEDPLPPLGAVAAVRLPILAHGERQAVVGQVADAGGAVLVLGGLDRARDVVVAGLANRSSRGASLASMSP